MSKCSVPCSVLCALFERDGRLVEPESGMIERKTKWTSRTFAMEALVRVVKKWQLILHYERDEP